MAKAKMARLVEETMSSSARRAAQFSIGVALTVLAWVHAGLAQQREAPLEFVPARTTIEFTLGASFHTVHGAFNLKHGAVQFNPATGAIAGEIVVDATGGHSGSDARDGRMHREILESARYPEITFRPDRVEGKVEPQGTSTIQVHGMFGIHGAEHEITLPVQVEMTQDEWTASSRFTIPYVKWGIKNPSTFILRVSQTVEIEVHASGANPWATSTRK